MQNKQKCQTMKLLDKQKFLYVIHTSIKLVQSSKPQSRGNFVWDG